MRTISGGWVCDDTTELAVTTIYRAQQRWLGISVVTRGGRRRGRSLAQVLSVRSPWLAPGDGQRITAVHGDLVEVPGHVAPSRAMAIIGELICSSRKARGYDD